MLEDGGQSDLYIAVGRLYSAACKSGERAIQILRAICPNPKCRELELTIQLHEWEKMQGSTPDRCGKLLRTWRLLPDSSAKIIPEYVPQAIREDYYEACRIVAGSPKAAATLARRCLQGMIRDFWQIKKSNLAAAIRALKNKVDEAEFDAIDSVRKIGNIGAHMEKNVNLIVDVDSGLRINRFDEKPKNPRSMPGAPGMCLASMGNYVFDPDVLTRALIEDSKKPGSNHDFGKDIIPELIQKKPVYAYNFMTNHIRGDSELNLAYWRDVGTLESYYDANMDLRDARPHLNLYNTYWPLRTAYYDQPPAKFVFNEDGRRGEALHSVVSEGCIISGGVVRNSVLGRSVKIHSYSSVDDSVLMDYAEVGQHARVRRAIVDKNVSIPDGEIIGYDLERDRKRFFVTDSGLVVIPKAPKREHEFRSHA